MNRVGQVMKQFKCLADDKVAGTDEMESEVTTWVGSQKSICGVLDEFVFATSAFARRQNVYARLNDESRES